MNTFSVVLHNLSVQHAGMGAIESVEKVTGQGTLLEWVSSAVCTSASTRFWRPLFDGGLTRCYSCLTHSP